MVPTSIPGQGLFSVSRMLWMDRLRSIDETQPAFGVNANPPTTESLAAPTWFLLTPNDP